MSWDHDTSPRGVLAAPSSSHQIYILSSVILTTSILSALGAGWIILSFAVFKQLRSFRHRLILGLAFSDFVMAINFLSSSAMNINGRDIGLVENKAFCSYNGFMTQVFVIQTDYWVLAIGVCTYLILSDQKIASSWAQDHANIICSLPWFFSVLWAIIGLATAGYGNIGAWCWFTSDKVRLFVNFIPRWLIIAIMLIMYARLYVVLFRAHRFMSSSEEGSRRAGVSNNRRNDAAASSSGQQQAHARRTQTLSTKRLKRLARLMIMYPVAYIFVWILPTSIRIYQACTGKAAPFALQTVDKACIVIQGVVDAFIYGINESSLSAWRDRFFPSSYLESEGEASVYRLSSRPGPQHSRAQTRPNHGSGDETSSTAHITMGASFDETAEQTSGRDYEADYGIKKTVEVRVAYGSLAG